MVKINENLVTQVVNRQYYDRNVLAETIERNMKSILLESGGISKEVVKECERIRNVIQKELSYAKPKSIENGVVQYKVNFDDTIFNEKYHFSISNINYRFYEIWRRLHQKYETDKSAYIDKEKKIILKNTVSIENDIVVSTFENSLQHELQHYFDVEKSGYTWATNDLYKLSFKLINTNKTVFNNDEELTELVNMIGYMFYISFQGEQQGFANGLYAFLNYNNVAKNSRTVNDYCRRDQSFRLLEILRALNNYLSEVLHTSKLEDAINYINTEYNQNFTVNKLHTMCQRVERDFCKKLNRAKGEYLSPNDIYESVLPKLNEYIPFIIKNNKIVCD